MRKWKKNGVAPKLRTPNSSRAGVLTRSLPFAHGVLQSMSPRFNLIHRKPLTLSFYSNSAAPYSVAMPHLARQTG
jgi:hypothetical protein